MLSNACSYVAVSTGECVVALLTSTPVETSPELFWGDAGGNTAWIWVCVSADDAAAGAIAAFRLAVRRTSPLRRDTTDMLSSGGALAVLRLALLKLPGISPLREREHCAPPTWRH